MTGTVPTVTGTVPATASSGPTGGTTGHCGGGGEKRGLSAFSGSIGRMSGGDEATLNLAAHFVDARVAEGLGGRTGDPHRRAALDLLRRRQPQLCLRQRAGGRGRPARRARHHRAARRRAFVGALFGILRRGAVVVMVNPELPPELAHLLLRVHARARRARASRVPAGVRDGVRGDAPRSRSSVVEDDADVSPSPRASTPPDFPPFPTHRDDAAIWLFSGGTTGPPEGGRPDAPLVREHDRALRPGRARLTADDITISVPKLFFGYATGSNLLFPFSVGASCVLFPERRTPESALRADRAPSADRPDQRADDGPADGRAPRRGGAQDL